VNRIIAALTQELGRSPTVREIAARADASEEDTIEAIEAARAYTADSLDAPGGAEGLAPKDVLAESDERLERLESWQTIAPAIRTLPERERTILYLRFFEDRTQSEIADELGISQMHVSRILSRTLSSLRERATS
jgi:RNA polymerase sigma-B factor